MQSAEQWGALTSRLGIRLGTRQSGSRHSIGRIGRGHTENGKSGKKQITSAHFFTRKKEGGYTGFFYAPSFRPLFFSRLPLYIAWGWASRWLLNTIKYISIDQRSNFCKRKIDDFAIMIEEVGTYSRWIYGEL